MLFKLYNQGKGLGIDDKILAEHMKLFFCSFIFTKFCEKNQGFILNFGVEKCFILR